MKIKQTLQRLGVMKQRLIGDNIVVHKDDLYRVWEERHLDRLFRRFEVDCVFDVGANIGQYAAMLREQVGYRGLIVSFEPNPESLRVLQDAARRDPKWVVEGLALSSASGEQTFNLMAGSQFSSLSRPRHDDAHGFERDNSIVRTVRVATETLGSAYGRLKERFDFSRPFLKLDTQGFDVEILRHGRDVVHGFVGLQSELSIRKLYEHSVDFRDAISFYEELGFVLSAFVPNNEGHFPMLVETDCIMVRKDLV